MSIKSYSLIKLVLGILIIVVLFFMSHTLANASQISIGSFSTKFNIENKPRVQNLLLASRAISGIVIYPGEVFSYNETLGPTTEERGFRQAEIIVKGEKKQGFGGGVCQISSTLYNAALNAGLEIIERHPHSKEVLYVPLNQDAATSYGGIDLKFKNTKLYPIVITSSITENNVIVNIYRYL